MTDGLTPKNPLQLADKRILFFKSSLLTLRHAVCVKATVFFIITLLLLTCLLSYLLTHSLTHLLTYLLTPTEFSLDGCNPYTSTDKTNKNKYTKTKQHKNTVQTIQNTVNTSTHITKTPIQLSKKSKNYKTDT